MLARLHAHRSTSAQPQRASRMTPALTLSAQLAAAINTTLRATVAIPKSRDWVHGFIVESVLSEVLEDGIPDSVEATEKQFSQLFFDNLDDVDAEDVTDFCTMLIKRLSELLNAESDGCSDNGSGADVGGCAMCERDMPLTKHHLIPRDVHSAYRKKGHTMEQLNQGVMICRPCHSAVHRTYDNKTLAAEYSTLERLLQSEELQRFVAWARKQRATSAHNLRYRR